MFINLFHEIIEAAYIHGGGRKVILMLVEKSSSKEIATPTLLIVVVLSVILFEFLPIVTLVATKRVAEDNSSNKDILQLQEKHDLTIAFVNQLVNTYNNLPGVMRSSNDEKSPSSSSKTGTNKPNKPKLLHSSFRLDEDVIKSLTSTAEKKSVSLSNLVNKTLKNYVTSEMVFEELGFIPVSKDFLRNVFNKLDEKQIEEFGRDLGLITAREYVSYFFPEVNSKTIIQFLDIWFKRFQSFSHKIDDDNYRNHQYTVSHDININFSLALKAILEALIEPIIKGAIEFKTISPTAVMFSFQVG